MAPGPTTEFFSGRLAMLAGFGFNSRLDDIHAAVLSVKLKHITAWTDRRREIDDGLKDVYRDLTIAPLACSIKAALALLGLEAGAPRLPYVELDEGEIAIVRELLERHGMLATAA